MALSSPTFSGSGLNDLTAGGSYTGTTAAIYVAEIVTAATPDTFRWRKDAGAWSEALLMTTAAYALSDGVTVTFAAATGHTVGNKWTITTGGQKVWPQLGLDERRSGRAPFPLELDGSQRWSTVIDPAAASAVGNDVIVHSVETGTYSTIEGEAIVTKVLTTEYVFGLAIHDDYQYTVTCLDSHTGAEVWNYTEDFALYSDHDCTLYAINMAIDGDYLCVFGLLEARTDDEIKHAPMWCHRYDMTGARVDAGSADLFVAPTGYPVLYDMYCNQQISVKDGKAYLQVVTQHIGSADAALASGATKNVAAWTTIAGMSHAAGSTSASDWPSGTTMGNFAGQTSANTSGTLSIPQQTRTIKGREYLIYSSGYIVYCLDVQSGRMKWTHPIAGVQKVEASPYFTGGTGTADLTVEIQHNGASPDLIGLGEKYIAVLVSKIDYDLHSNFLVDLGAGDEEVSNYATYNSAKHYLYIIDYDGNFRGEVELRTEVFGDYGNVAFPGGTYTDLCGYRGNVFEDIPETYLGLPLDHVDTYDPYHEDPALHGGDYGYFNDNGTWVDVYHYVAFYRSTEPVGGQIRALNSTLSTRSEFSKIIMNTEGGVDYAYVTRSGSVDASYPSTGTQNYTYKVNCSTRTIDRTDTGTGTVAAVPMYGAITAPADPGVWPENVNDPENPYTLTMEQDSAGFKIRNGATVVTYAAATYKSIKAVRFLTNDYLWFQKEDAGVWYIAIAQIGSDCTFANEWVSTTVGPGATAYVADARDKLISGTTYATLIMATNAAGWVSLKFEPTGGAIETIFDVVFAHSSNFKTDGVYSYFWDVSANAVYQYSNADGTKIGDLSVDSKLWRSLFALTRTKAINIAKDGSSIVVQAVDKHGGQYQNNLLVYDLAAQTAQGYHTEQAAFVPGELVLTDSWAIMMVGTTITALSATGTTEWTDATGVFVQGTSYKVGEDEYIYLLMDDLVSVRKYSIGGSLLDTLTLPYALSAPGMMCLYEWETEVPGAKVPVLVFAGQTWMVSISDGHSSTDVNWSAVVSTPVQGALYDLGTTQDAIVYSTGGTAVSVHADNTTGATYTDLDDMLLQSAPAAGDLYYYSYGFDDVSGEARLIALKSGLEYMDVASSTPAHEATAVTRAVQPSVTFTQQPDVDTITTSSVSLKKVSDSSEIAYTVQTCSDRVLTIKPDETLEALTEYSLTLSTDITALDDTALHAEHVITFITGDDIVALEVVDTSPAADALDVAYTTKTLTATFDADIDPATLTGQVTISPVLTLTATASGNVLTITLTDTGMTSDTDYTVTLGTGILSTDAAAMAAEYVWTFTTATQPFPPTDEEEWQYEYGDVCVEEPQAAYAEHAEIILRSPTITSSSGDHPPKWRLHFKVDSYSDSGHLTLLQSVSSESTPGAFSYSADGVTWENFPADGLPPEQYGKLVKVEMKVGRGVAAYLVPSFGAEPA